MTDGTYTLYSSTTCTRCPLAIKSMERAGASYEEVKLDLPENEDKLARFRAEAEASNRKVEVPMILTPDGRMLTNLATISEEFRAAA